MSSIDNSVYATLGERWYEASDDPIALLRAESRLHNPWIAERLASRHGVGCEVLDLACGGGFLANDLARRGFRVTGVDLAPEALEVARRHDETRSVRYETGDARALRFADASFDAVCAMDFLEHVEEPDRVIAEAARVLRPGGVFVFHTFNRNWLSRLVVIHGVEWFVSNVPPRLHVYPLFIRPDELERACAESGLEIEELVGSRPEVFRAAFWKMLFTGRVPGDFRFRFTSSLAISYSGIAVKKVP